jgi:anti-anti-sigma factor
LEVLRRAWQPTEGDIAENDLQQAHERVTVLDLQGPLDMTAAPAFRRRVRQLVSAGVSQVVVDLGQVSFVDSTGLGAVLGALKLVRERGGDLRILRPNDQVQLLLGLTSLDLVLRQYATAEDDVPIADLVPLVEVECVARPDQLEIIHEALARFWAGMRAPPPDEPRMLFEIAISEIASNIVKHARPQVMHLWLAASGDEITADFWDTGLLWIPPDETGEPEPLDEPADLDELDDLERLAERGRGLSIARAALDHLHYQRDGTTNRWRLLKRM